MPIKELIGKRRSVRTYDGQMVPDELLADIDNHIENSTNPFGVPIEFRMLDALKNDLSSKVIVGEHTYVAAKMKHGAPNGEIAYGYAFEEFCLYALSKGLGTVMLAASLSRDTFEKALDVADDEVMPLGSPIGFPAKKQSLRESLMRKGTGANNRLPFKEIFFENSFDTSLKPERAGDFREALEMVRLAPSAVNKQPWRIVLKDNALHIYEKRTIRENPMGDIQKVDIGIALAHLDLTIKEEGKQGEFFFDEPDLTAPDQTYYIVSYKLV